MKKELWMGYTGTLKASKISAEDTFLGYIEVEAPKKTVTKEIRVDEASATNMGTYTRIHFTSDGPLPSNAKNVRILFDVEE